MTLPLKRSDWPEIWREAFEERAAIMEFLGNMERQSAEWMAERAVRREEQQEARAAQ